MTDGGEGRYVDFAVMCTKTTRPDTLLAAFHFRMVARGRSNLPLLAGLFVSCSVSGKRCWQPAADGLGAHHQLHITFARLAGEIAISQSGCPEHRGTLKMRSHCRKALLALANRASGDLTQPVSKFGDTAP